MGLILGNGKGWAFSAVLPPADPIFSLFDIPSSLTGVIRLGERDSDWAGSRPADNTIQSILKGGGSVSSRKKLEDYLRHNLPSYDMGRLNVDLWAELHGAVFRRHKWRSFLLGLPTLERMGPEVGPCIDLINHRIALEAKLQKELYPGELEGHPVENALEVLARYVNFPDVWEGLISRYSGALGEMISDRAISRADTFDLQLCLDLDFVLQALAAMEKGILVEWNKLAPDLYATFPLLGSQGLVQPILPTSVGDPLHGPYSAFLDLLATRFTGEKFNSGSLSKSIPVKDKASKDKEELREAQKDLLKKWRKGKAYPSFDVMSELLEHRIPGSSAKWGIQILERCARALDRLFREHVGYAKKHAITGYEEIVIRAYSRYRRMV